MNASIKVLVPLFQKRGSGVTDRGRLCGAGDSSLRVAPLRMTNRGKPCTELVGKEKAPSIAAVCRTGRSRYKVLALSAGKCGAYFFKKAGGRRVRTLKDSF